MSKSITVGDLLRTKEYNERLQSKLAKTVVIEENPKEPKKKYSKLAVLAETVAKERNKEIAKNKLDKDDKKMKEELKEKAALINIKKGIHDGKI